MLGFWQTYVLIVVAFVSGWLASVVFKSLIVWKLRNLYQRINLTSERLSVLEQDMLQRHANEQAKVPFPKGVEMREG